MSSLRPRHLAAWESRCQFKEPVRVPTGHLLKAGDLMALPYICGEIVVIDQGAGQIDVYCELEGDRDSIRALSFHGILPSA